MRLARTALPSIFLLLAVGCGSVGDEVTPQARPGGSGGPAGSTASAAARPGDLLASCVDGKGDAALGVDLTGVELRRQGDGSLLFIYAFEGELPATGSVSFSTVDIGARKSYAYLIRNGDPNMKLHAVSTVGGATPGEPQMVEGVEEVADGEARIGFPAAELTSRGKGANAALRINAALDTCNLS